MRNHVLEISHLHKKFGKLHAVNNLSFSVEKGNVYGLLGPNGSGKSTTLGMILNVVNPTSGSWKWFGEKASPKHLQRIGAIIESPKFYPYLTAYQNLKIVAKIKYAPEKNIDEKLELVGLLDRKNDKFSGFSLGMKQRLAIAGALLNNPDVLILDEPTNGLDPQGIHQIRQLIQTISQTNTTIILASHLLDEVEKVCSHVVVLKKGQSLYAGEVDDMIRNSDFFEVGTENIEQLTAWLSNADWVEQFKQNNHQIKLYTKQELSATKLNQMAFSQNIVFNHLVKRKASLEQQFIKLTESE